MRKLEKQVSRINAEHSDLTLDILSLEHEDRDLLDLSSALAKTLFDLSSALAKTLFDLSSALAKALFDLSLQIERLLSDQAAPPPTNGTKPHL